MKSPITQHLAAVKHIFRYVSGTLNFSCYYEKMGNLEPKLVGYCDSDLASDVDDCKSTTGTIFFFGSSIITWLSQKQKIVALSSCKAEYIAAMTAACQGIWLERLMVDLLKKEVERFELRIDNKSAISFCKNPVHHERSKHIDMKYHFIRECVEVGKMEAEHISLEKQRADVLTKALGRVKFLKMRQKLGVKDV